MSDIYTMERLSSIRKDMERQDNIAASAFQTLRDRQISPGSPEKSTIEPIKRLERFLASDEGSIVTSEHWKENVYRVEKEVAACFASLLGKGGVYRSVCVALASRRDAPLVHRDLAYALAETYWSTRDASAVMPLCAIALSPLSSDNLSKQLRDLLSRD